MTENNGFVGFSTMIRTSTRLAYGMASWTSLILDHSSIGVSPRVLYTTTTTGLHKILSSDLVTSPFLSFSKFQSEWSTYVSTVYIIFLFSVLIHFIEELFKVGAYIWIMFSLYYLHNLNTIQKTFEDCRSLLCCRQY